MALDKNDGIFLPSIDGVVSGKTSQVDGMNGIMNNLIGNDNYLEDKKLDRGNYVGSGELLRKDDNGIWGGEYGGKIQDPIPKELNKRYIDNINGKAFICIKAGDSSVTSNTIEYFTPCNVVDNLDKLQNLDYKYSLINGFHIFKYIDGRLKIFKSASLSNNNLVVGEIYTLQLTLPVKFVRKTSDINNDISFSLSHYANSPNMIYSHWYGNPSYPNCDLIIRGTPLLRNETGAPFSITLEGWWK